MTDESRRSGVEGDPPCVRATAAAAAARGENWTPGVFTTTIMGCNLCTLQKREEHYKLLYEIAQVSRGTANSGMALCMLCCDLSWVLLSKAFLLLLLLLLVLF